MSEETILVKGPALRVAIVGAFLARRWLGNHRSLFLAPDSLDALPATILARPDHMRFQAEIGLGLDALIKAAGAKPAFAPSYKSASGPLNLPFAPIGQSQGGVEFQHFWMRANNAAPQADLLAFSPAIVLEQSDDNPSLQALQKSAPPFGLELQASQYVRGILGLAASAGAVVQAADQELPKADLTIDCAGVAAPSWAQGSLSLLEEQALPGLEWQVSVNAVRRFVALSADLSNHANEAREYTRLARQEAERIADMEALLSATDPRETERPALRRKVELFEACGRIPTQDFEVFTPPEWLAALWGRDLRPRRYDRMADRLPQAQLMNWIADLQRQCEQLNRKREMV
ncbi:hypothetical protein EH31_11935 [Erythrobacter longus]|uniref:Tryptophan halogenase n=1 Tax=Erythrobacter longus TaxID=1044 RepID=A0A074M574_ERYLO|nr:tryptophan 7-halogenase [Erythrobacter longus]KEO89856.1 hypothetical protein EH31_11935 [Erythrobacter longus]